jgi:phage tail-like protein
MSKTSVIPTLFLALLLSAPSVLRAQDSCQPARGQVVLEGQQVLVFYVGGTPDAPLTIHVAVTVDALATARAGGIARITDGTSNTILISEKWQVLSCADINLDGIAGVTELVLTMQDVHGGAELPLALVPVDGEVDSGLEQMTIAIGGLTFVESVKILGPSSLDEGSGPERGLTYRFAVRANNGQTDLGSWSNVSGLDATWDIAEYRSGDEANSYQRQFLSSFEQGTITLHRAAGTETALVKDWLDQLAQSFEPTTVTITLLDALGEPVARWKLTGVFPTKWEVSAPDGGESKIAIETLVLAYESLVVETPPSGR